MDYLFQFLDHLLRMILDTAPWLMLGLLASALLKAFFPMRLLGRWLGGRGGWPIVNAALIGTPIPLCSCSVIPAAVTLRRSGASRGATVSFLIATPENGADSISLSYALLGPFMTVVRPVAAIASAVLAGVITQLVPEKVQAQKTSNPLAIAGGGATDDCCSSGDNCCGDAPEKSEATCCSTSGESESDLLRRKPLMFGARSVAPSAA